METFSRVLAIAVAVISIAFMGFAGAVTFGGPNWDKQKDEMTGYVFDLSEGENPTWSVTRMQGREKLQTESAVLPEVVAAAMVDRKNQANTELDLLTKQEPGLRQQIDQYTQMQAADYAALQAYHKERIDELDQARKQADQVRSQADSIAVEVTKIEDQIESRRNDVFRLELQHRIITGESQRIEQILKAVEEEIRLAEDELEKATRRSKALDQQSIPAAE